MYKLVVYENAAEVLDSFADLPRSSGLYIDLSREDPFIGGGRGTEIDAVVTIADIAAEALDRLGIPVRTMRGGPR